MHVEKESTCKSRIDAYAPRMHVLRESLGSGKACAQGVCVHRESMASGKHGLRKAWPWGVCVHRQCAYAKRVRVHRQRVRTGSVCSQGVGTHKEWVRTGSVYAQAVRVLREWVCRGSHCRLSTHHSFS